MADDLPTMLAPPPSPRQLRRLPPISGGGRKKQNGAAATDGADSAERAARAWMRQALAKRVAMRMLKRSTAPPRPPATAEGAEGEGSGGGGGRRVLACCCARLPAGMRCALHQAAAPGRAWIVRAQQQCRGGGGECGEAAVAVAA